MSEFYIERNTTGGPPKGKLNASEETSADGGGYSFRFYGRRPPQSSGGENQDDSTKDPPLFEQPPVEVQISAALIAESEGQEHFPPPAPENAVVPPEGIKNIVEQSLQKAQEMTRTDVKSTADPKAT